MKVLSQKIITSTHTCTKHINMMRSRGSIEKQVNTRKTIQSYRGRRHLRTCENIWKKNFGQQVSAAAGGRWKRQCKRAMGGDDGFIACKSKVKSIRSVVDNNRKQCIRAEQ